MATSRRGFLGGALAGAAVPLLGSGVQTASAKPLARAKTVRLGRALAVSRDGRTFVVAHERRRTIAIKGRHGSTILDVGGQPVEVAISPDGREAAVATGAWDEPGLTVVDLRVGKVRKRVEAGLAPLGVSYADRGRRIVVVGEEAEGQVRVFDSGRLALLARERVGISPAAVALDPDGEHVWVSLAGMDRVTRLRVADGRPDTSFDVPAVPDRIAVSRDGRRVLVSHGSPGADEVTEIDLEKRRLKSHQAGRLPSAVAWTRGDSRLIALAGRGEVVEITRTGRRKRHAVGGSPRGLALARGRAWTVDALTGKIERVRS